MSLTRTAAQYLMKKSKSKPYGFAVHFVNISSVNNHIYFCAHSVMSVLFIHFSFVI